MLTTEFFSLLKDLLPIQITPNPNKDRPQTLLFENRIKNLFYR